jgi:hypothetical protein
MHIRDEGMRMNSPATVREITGRVEAADGGARRAAGNGGQPQHE